MAPNSPAALRVEQIMSKGIITCRPDDTLEYVARLMSDAEVSSVVVVDETGQMKGLISQFDLLGEFGQDLLRRADDCMVKELLQIGPQDLVSDAAKLMLARKIHRLIVTDHDRARALGVISISDVIRKMRPDTAV